MPSNPQKNTSAGSGASSQNWGNSGDLFQTLGEAIPGLLWICDPKGLCDYASRSCFDYAGEEFCGPDKMGAFSFTHPDERADLSRNWQDALLAGKSHETDLRVRRRDGIYRWHRARGVPERDENNTIRRWVVVCIDIEEARKASKEFSEMRETLKRTKEDLERTVDERTHQLRDVVEQLETFTYSIAHDMRAPLRTMHQYAELVARDFALDIPPEARGYLNRIMGAAEKLDALIREVLVYTRVSQGPMHLHSMSLERVLSEITIMHPQLSSPDVEFIVSHPLLEVIGDEIALTQAIGNLLTNALKFVPPGKKPKIEVWTELAGDNVKVSVKDNGVGVAAEDQERIFKMFERLQPTLDTQGSGIGLTIVRRAVERMNGKLGVTSIEGQGSTFWIELKKGNLC